MTTTKTVKKKVSNKAVETYVAKLPTEIKDIKPVGNMVLVEMLTEHELLGTALLTINNKRSNQGYIVELGNLVVESYGFKPGQRVWLQGSCIELPKYGNNERERIVALPDMIKAFLVE